MTNYCIIKTPVDDLILVANGNHLTGLYFLECEHAPATPDDWVLDPRHAVLERAGEQLRQYFEGSRKDFSLPLRLEGTPFQQRVWREIATIPFGQTITYGDLAKRVGAPKAIRAAGMATGRNPVGIVVPCHRVVGKDGSLTGYAGGLARKRHLLELEMRVRDANFALVPPR